MKSGYNIYWTDMHSNLHHEKITALDEWHQQIKQLMDFWPIAYYPYLMRPLPSGWNVEDFHDLTTIQADWELIRALAKKADNEGFPFFMGYEWQGSGQDGDHNVFFKDNKHDPVFPLRYAELEQTYHDQEVIAIPHHLAYQLGNRGKNWTTHNEIFSPFVEIYSSHGSSENDRDALSMDRHIHMGPRTGQTSVEKGWEKGYQFGIIASGDNHSVPGASDYGTMACLATDNTKDALWDAFIHKRVYGVSKDRIKLNYCLDGHSMGSTVSAQAESALAIEVEGSNRLDRIELIADNRVIDVISHLSPLRTDQLTDLIRCKFKIEFGWGPDRRIFPEIAQKSWVGNLSVEGDVISIEKCWNNFGQKLENVSDHGFDFTLTSYKNAANDKWMATSAMATEGFIIEIESRFDASVLLNVNGNQYQLLVAELLNASQIIDLYDDSFDLIKSKYNFTDYYRSDSWWHNSYKIKVGQAARFDDYTVKIQKKIDTRNFSHLRCRVWQNNGSVAWSSPIFMKKEIL